MADATAHVLAVDRAARKLVTEVGRMTDIYVGCVGVPEPVGDVMSAYWKLCEARRLLKAEMRRNKRANRPDSRGESHE